MKPAKHSPGVTVPVVLGPRMRALWYESLYLKRTDKTRQRDLRGLRDAKMSWIDSEERLMPGFTKPDSEFQLGARDKG